MMLKKSLGQHLLTDAPALERIAGLLRGGPDSVALEIGPGTGNLTAHLLERVGCVVAVEIDSGMCARLSNRFAGEPRLEVVFADILEADLAALARRVSPGGPMEAVGNLPYYITTPILMKLMAHADIFTRIVALVQEEVAHRIAASPGGRAYGSLSVACQARAHCALGPRVPRECFNPAPEVDSAVVVIDTQPSPNHGIEDMESFERMVRGAFEHRRKTCYNSLRFSLEKGILKGFFDADPEARLQTAFERADVSPLVRPEEISVRQFAALASEMSRV
jgi:16S rRNA (adenine1518-N6/adenine1519-N6)-dimethyltransferase